MMEEEKMTDEPQFPEAELARLADGSLPASRAAELRAEVARSPALQASLAEQERAVAMLRSVDEPAPDSLRQWLDERSREKTVARRARWRLRVAFPAVAAVAAAAALVIVLASGGTGAPTIEQTTHLALAAAVSPAPGVASDRVSLTQTSAGIAFPNWGATTGWRATGTRTDRLAGRQIVTVFYGRRSYRVGYAIVGGTPLAVKGGVKQTSSGVTFTFLRYGGADLITWVRSGHTCLIAGNSVDDATLLALATAEAPKSA